jgi:hypothetical protein
MPADTGGQARLKPARDMAEALSEKRSDGAALLVRIARPCHTVLIGGAHTRTVWSPTVEHPPLEQGINRLVVQPKRGYVF